MSLLLDALKKAERAKEEAQRRARDGSQASAASPALELEPPAPPPSAEPLRTREQLPEIDKPIELQIEEPPVEPMLPPQPPPAAAPSTGASRPQAKASTAEGERAAARKVFEAKFREPNPRLPFFIALGALGVFAVGTVVYFWIQLRPAPALVNTNPQRPAGEVAAAQEVKPAPRIAPQTTQGAIPGLPAVTPAIAAAPAAPTEPPVKPVAPRVEVPRLQPPLRRVEPAQSEITATRTPAQVHPRVGAGYAAYVAGDLASARAEYQQALQEEPANRDARLGLAALDVRSGRYEAAEAAYLRLLQADPRDAHAHAALIALRAGRVDPVVAESRVKSMLADNPSAHVLNFALGNQFAQQGRWAEAQQEYFKAYAAEPDNADFAYNLAVSLDHLRQARLAVDYYTRALSLAKSRAAGFDAAAAKARVEQLAR